MNRKRDSLIARDVAERAHIGVDSCPLCEATVLSSFQQVLAPAVVGELIEDPGTLRHLGRVNLSETPAVGQVAQIFSALQHLTAKVRTLEHTNPGHTRRLQDREQEVC